MNQEKIGKFLAELRKERGMTQQQLADALGVSNKTISKWECGNGMPEISLIMPLCQLLQISVNELLSGERLSTEAYSEKAEENMMSLIKETEDTKKKNNYSFLTLIIILLAILLGVGGSVVTCMGVSKFTMLVDAPTATIMLVVTVLCTWGAGMGGSFVKAFGILTGRTKNADCKAISRAKSAVELVGNLLLGTGALVTCTSCMAILLYYNGDETVWIHLSISVALLGILYGIIGYLLFLPIRVKLDVMSKEA